MAQDFVEPWCERYLGEYMIGMHGFNGVINHPEYLSISRCLRKIVKRNALPLVVMATRGHIIVNIDPDVLTSEERASYDETNQALIDSMFSDDKPRVFWPLHR